MPNRDPDANRTYIREYMRKRKLGLVPVLRQASLESALPSEPKRGRPQELDPEARAIALRDYKRRYHRDMLTKRRADWLAAHGPCVRCGSTEQLEVDHIDPSKKVTHNVWSWSLARRSAELAKCQVLCHDCHALKTAADRGEEVLKGKHATPQSYRHCGPRICSACREARAAIQRIRRANKLPTAA